MDKNLEVEDFISRRRARTWARLIFALDVVMVRLTLFEKFTIDANQI